MGYVEGIHRNQLTLFPEALDDYIAGDNPVRFLDAFVENLDLQEMGLQRVVPAETGRPPYHPGDMLRLYVYGYIKRIRSSRLLEREACRNLEEMWLLKRLAPDFKTIADFRKDNGEAIRKVCGEFTMYCRKAGLFSGELIAIDGSKFKAVNARNRNFSARKVKSALQEIEGRIEQYLKELEANNQDEKNLPRFTAKELKRKVEMLKKRKRSMKKISKSMEESGENQVSLIDSDIRSMPVGKDHGTDVGYNVWVSVDAKHKLILDHEVTKDPMDQGHLSEMAIRSKEILGEERLEVVANRGYCDGREVETCVQEGITPHIAKTYTSANRKLGHFAKEDFRCNKKKDCYHCPAGKTLTFRFQAYELGRDIRYYATSACHDCSIRSRCTRNAGGRRITPSVKEDLLDSVERRIRSHPEMLRRRKGIVEHPFGTMKRSMNQGYFLMRGFKNVRTEMSLTVLAYNLKRVLNILGTKKMVRTLA